MHMTVRRGKVSFKPKFNSVKDCIPLEYGSLNIGRLVPAVSSLEIMQLSF